MIGQTNRQTNRDYNFISIYIYYLSSKENIWPHIVQMKGGPLLSEVSCFSELSPMTRRPFSELCAMRRADTWYLVCGFIGPPPGSMDGFNVTSAVGRFERSKGLDWRESLFVCGVVLSVCLIWFMLLVTYCCRYILLRIWDLMYAS